MTWFFLYYCLSGVLTPLEKVGNGVSDKSRLLFFMLNIEDMLCQPLLILLSPFSLLSQ
jgi:hypothetical protein